MIKIIIIIIALLAGLILGPEISANKGYLLISIDGYTTYETTIINALFIALIFYFLLLFAEWIIRKLLSMNSITCGWLASRKTKKAQKNSMLGMFALLEGNNKQAQKLLEKSAPRSESPALTYIAAARAAHGQGKYDLRDQYFQRAYDSKEGGQLAAGIARAELQIEVKQYQAALVTLQELEKKFPKNQRISKLYLSVYPTLQQWENYLELLKRKRSAFAFDDTEIATMQFDAYQHLFREKAEEGGEALQLFWEKKLPRSLRKESKYQMALLTANIDAGNHEFAEKFLLNKIDKQFSLPLLAYLKDLQLSNYDSLILLLEKKLDKEQDKGLIHQALAYLQLKENKTAEAIEHLQESVKTAPTVKDFALLADLLQKEERNDEANEYFREGLLLATATTD